MTDASASGVLPRRPRTAVSAAAALAAALALSSLACPSPASADRGVSLLRPLIADPRESLSSWRRAEFTEDRRYGTDITDSLSRGGWERGVRGVRWTVSAGENLRWRPQASLLGWRGPWRRIQLGAPAAIFALFDDSGSELNVDYQFGASLDALWSGAYEEGRGLVSFDRPVLTTRLAVMHRSSHLGDEYLSLGRFGRNQEGLPPATAPFAHPPVKRVDLSAESLRGVLSAEWAPPFGTRRGTLRGYGGGELRLAIPRRWKVGGLVPTSMRSPVGQLGFEWRSAANQRDPADGVATRLLGRVAGRGVLESEWFAAVDLKLARPVDFAGCDNPDGDEEAWTPRLWTPCNCGHEFARYAGSWHATAGLALTPRALRATGPDARLLPAEWLLALEWYRGYSPDGQFLDQRLRSHPRWFVLPSVTAHF